MHQIPADHECFWFFCESSYIVRTRPGRPRTSTDVHVSERDFFSRVKLCLVRRWCVSTCRSNRLSCHRRTRTSINEASPNMLHRRRSGCSSRTKLNGAHPVVISSIVCSSSSSVPLQELHRASVFDSPNRSDFSNERRSTLHAFTRKRTSKII